MEDRQQYVKARFGEVGKVFPEIKEDEIEIICVDGKEKLASYFAFNQTTKKKEPLIVIWELFFDLPKEAQAVVIAHEVGHHEVLKNFSIPRLERNYKWLEMYKYRQFPPSRPHWKQRLKKLNFLAEIVADNKVAKTKYGKGLLKYYNNIQTDINQIANLEAKLGSA